MAKGMVSIDTNRCKGCGLCVPVCPPKILRLSKGKLNTKGYPPVEVIEMSDCTGCALCAVVCPDVVFTVYRATRRARAA